MWLPANSLFCNHWCRHLCPRNHLKEWGICPSDVVAAFTQLTKQYNTKLNEAKITAWSRVLVEKVIVPYSRCSCNFQEPDNFLPYSHWSLFSSWLIQSTLFRLTSLGSILIYPPIYLWVSKCFRSPDFFTATLCTPFPYTCHTPFQSLLVLITTMLIGEEYKSWCFSLFSLLQSPFNCSFTGPNISPST